MNFQYIFPTIIGYSNDIDVATATLPVALEYLSKDNLINKSCGYKTTYGIDLNDSVDVRLKPYCDLIRTSFKDIMIHQGFEVPDIGIEIFFNDMKTDDYHPKHCHANSLFSGVLYLDTPENCSQIVFSDPRPHVKFIDFHSKDSNDTNQYYVTPRNGLFIIFNSWLEHEVLKNKSNSPRISAPFNIYYDRLSLRTKS
jgi:hypothetical protein